MLKLLPFALAGVITLLACTNSSKSPVADADIDATVAVALRGTLEARGRIDNLVETALAETQIAASTQTSTAVPSPVPSTATAVPSPTPAVLPTPSPVPTSEPTPTPSPTPTAIPTSTSVPTVQPTPIATATIVPVPTALTLAELIDEVGDSVVRVDTATGSGSGIVVSVDENGAAWILTNNHVIEFATNVEVLVKNETLHAGSIVSADIVRDLAIVKICCDNSLAPVQFSSSVQVGASVAALGYPLGIDTLRISGGIISGEQADPARDRVEFQTDAAINPGNSGGPLMQLDGTVAGINTYVIRAQVGQTAVEGLGFAIGAETLARVVPGLIRGSVVPPPSQQFDDSAPNGKYTNTRYEYQLDMPEGWMIDKSDVDDVVAWPLRNNVFARVQVVTVTPGPETESIFSYTNVFTLAPYFGWDFFLISAEVGIVRAAREDRPGIPGTVGWEFLYSYSVGNREFFGITQWYLITNGGNTKRLSASIQIPRTIWTDSQYLTERSDIRDVLNSLRFS